MSKRNHAVAMDGHPVVDSTPLGCMKAGYVSEDEAKKVGAKYQHNAYKCPMCEAWHLLANRNGKATRAGYNDRMRWWT